MRKVNCAELPILGERTRVCAGQRIVFLEEIDWGSEYGEPRVMPGDRATIRSFQIDDYEDATEIELQLADGRSVDLMLDGIPDVYDVFVFAEDVGTAGTIEQELAAINAYRRKLGQRPLDPFAAGWSDDDVRKEAQRLRAMKNPRRSASVREELLAW